MKSNQIKINMESQPISESNQNHMRKVTNLYLYISKDLKLWEFKELPIGALVILNCSNSIQFKLTLFTPKAYSNSNKWDQV